MTDLIKAVEALRVSPPRPDDGQGDYIWNECLDSVISIIRWYSPGRRASLSLIRQFIHDESTIQNATPESVRKAKALLPVIDRLLKEEK